MAGWKPTTFGAREHASLRLPLTGKHASANCGSCHSGKRSGLPPLAAGRALGTANVALALTETTCDACHRDPHGGKYAGTPAATQPAGTCVGCHDTRAFHPSTIDAEAHGRFAFALEGGHRAAPCVACHTAMKTATSGASLKLSAGKPPAVVVYALPGATCTSCHGTPHGDQFARRADGGACESCHDLRGWAPASRFVHEANGGFALGTAHARVACARCHVVPAGGPGAVAAARTWRGVPRTCESCHRGDARKGD
ncbi:MAG: cytochrome c3 family protein [Solirubrobacteraceae bacterium]